MNRRGLGLAEVLIAFALLLLLSEPAHQLLRPPRQRLTAQTSRAESRLDLCVTHLTRSLSE